MSIQYVRDKESLASIKDDWNELVSDPLERFEWYSAWWQHLGNSSELSIYTYRKGGRIVGVAPFIVDRWWGQNRLRFIGSGVACTDYARVFAEPHYQSEFFEELAEEIQSARSLAIVEMEGGLVGGANEELGQALSDCSFKLHTKTLDPTFVLDLPADWETFRSNCKGSLRRKINKAFRRFQSGELKIKSCSKNEIEFNTAFTILVALHQKRFDSKGIAGSLADPKFEQFLFDATSQLNAAGLIELIVLFHDGKPIGAQIYLKAKTGWQFYQSGAEPTAMNFEPGYVMFSHQIRESIQAGFRQLDFLRGSEDYKEFWGARPVEIGTIRAIRRTAIPSLLGTGEDWLRKTKQGIRSIMSNR